MKAIIIDLDGTLCNNSHRVPHLHKKPRDWDTYNSLMFKDKLNMWCRRIMEHFSSTHFVLIVTGRMQTVDIERMTLEWLQKHDVPYNKIFFRNDDDFRDDSIIKKEIYHEKIEPDYEVEFVVDDRQRVVDMWRKLGLTCLQCQEGQY